MKAAVGIVQSHFSRQVLNSSTSDGGRESVNPCHWRQFDSLANCTASYPNWNNEFRKPHRSLDSLDSQWQLKFWFYQFWSFCILIRLNSLTRLRFSSELNTRFPFHAQFLSIKTIVEAWILAPWLVGPFGCTFHVKNRKLISSFWRPDIVPVVSDSTKLKMAWHSMDIRFFIRFFSSRRFLFCIGRNCMHLPRVYRLVCHHNNHYRLKMCKPQKWLLFIRQSSPQHTQFSTFTVCATFSLSPISLYDVRC